MKRLCVKVTTPGQQEEAEAEAEGCEIQIYTHSFLFFTACCRLSVFGLSPAKQELAPVSVKARRQLSVLPNSLRPNIHHRPHQWRPPPHPNSKVGPLGLMLLIGRHMLGGT